MYIALRASLRAIVTGLLYFREFYRSSSIQKVMKQGRVYEVALIALLWRFRMPLEAPPGALSHFLLAGCLVSAALVMASSGICAPPSPPSASHLLYYLPFAPLCDYCPFLFSLY